LITAEAVAYVESGHFMKKVIAERVRRAMEKRHYNQAQLARAMNSKRVQVQRLLDPENTSCTLATLASAFTVLGLKLDVSQKPRRGISLPPTCSRPRKTCHEQGSLGCQVCAP